MWEGLFRVGAGGKRTPISDRLPTGIGKPEPLKHQLAGFWSRRIDDRHRLVYAVEGEVVLIAQCRDHY